MKNTISARIRHACLAGATVLVGCAVCAGLAFGIGGTTPADLIDEVEPATEEFVIDVCSMCHFVNVGNLSLSSFEPEECDAATIETMLPMMSDEIIASIAAYYVNLEEAGE